MAIESIVRALKTDIVAGKFAPGGKLPSLQEMQKIFGVGRGTIREALKVLEGMGLLEMKKGRTGGAFLTSRSNQIVAKSLADMFKVEEFNILSFIAFRKTIEPRIVRQAVLERKAHDQEDMKAALDLLSEEAISRETFLTATSGFYRAIASANQNQYLEGLFEYTLPALAETCKLLYEIPVVVDLSKHFYWQIYQAILEGDPEKGEMIVEGYLLQLEDKVKKAKSLGVRPAGSNGVIKWGFMADLSGTLMDYGKQCATGMMDAARYINETGGINGKKIELIIVDDKYKVSESRKAYDSFKNSGVQGIYIQSTGAAQFLIPQASNQRVFMFTSATSSKLLNPATAPYHFTLGPTYGDMSRAVLKYIRMIWAAQNRSPRLVFMFPDNPYGREPLEAVQDYAREVGVEIGPSQIVNWPTLDATQQLTAVKNYNPDFVFITSSALNVANILKDAKRLGVDAQFICNLRVFTEDLPKFAMEAAEGVLGVQPFSPYGFDVPGMERIVKHHNIWHPYHHPTLVYVEGWLNMLVPMEACRMADQAGDLSADGLKAALETFRDYDTGDLLPPLSYFDHDHRSTTQTRIYRIDSGEMIPITGFIDVGRDDSYFKKAGAGIP